jgi:hypothetical protein
MTVAVTRVQKACFDPSLRTNSAVANGEGSPRLSAEGRQVRQFIPPQTLKGSLIPMKMTKDY